MLGDYCAGRDKTREGYIDPLHPDEDFSEYQSEPELPKHEEKHEALPSDLHEPNPEDFGDFVDKEKHYYDQHYDK